MVPAIHPPRPGAERPPGAQPRPEGSGPHLVERGARPVSSSVGAGSYLTSTVAPTSSSFFLMSALSALVTFSLTALGAPSTRSLASLMPRPVSSRTTLMTWIFFSPAADRMTSNSVCSSTAAAPAPAVPGMAATATGAAADTPHFSCSIFDSCAASSRVSLSSCSAISSTLAMTSPCLGLFGRVLAALGEDVRELSLWRLEQTDELGQRPADRAHELGPQGFLRRKLGKRLQRVRLHEPAVDVAALDRE